MVNNALCCHLCILCFPRMPCHSPQPYLRVSRGTPCLSAHRDWTCRPSYRCCGAGCPTPSWVWRRPGSVRGTAGWSSVWNRSRCWLCIFPRKTGGTRRSRRSRTYSGLMRSFILNNHSYSHQVFGHPGVIWAGRPEEVPLPHLKAVLRPLCPGQHPRGSRPLQPLGPITASLHHWQPVLVWNVERRILQCPHQVCTCALDDYYNPRPEGAVEPHMKYFRRKAANSLFVF